MKELTPSKTLLILIKSLIVIVLTGWDILQVCCKRYDKFAIQELPGSSVLVKPAGCEFDCDRDCALDPNCLATTFWKNGTCKVVQYGGVTLQNDSTSVAKTRGTCIS